MSKATQQVALLIYIVWVRYLKFEQQTVTGRYLNPQTMINVGKFKLSIAQ
jgi:hypothetical protein